MRKSVWVISCLSMFATAAYAAEDMFPGQFHVIPDGQDYQSITLVGVATADCPAGLGLTTVDETGHLGPPFVVPGRTVFILTDASFAGIQNTALGGYTTMLSISRAGVATKAVADFLISAPLKGVANEPFAGSGSLQTGPSFSTGAKLCARMMFSPNQDLPADATVHSITVHGKLIDDSRTSSWPYFSW